MSVAWTLTLTLTLTFTFALAATREAKATLAVTATTQNYDFYTPNAPEKSSAGATAKSPILIFVHGGAWVSGSASQYRALGQALRLRGVCVGIIDYRLASVAPHPAPVEDLAKAIEHIKSTVPQTCDANDIFLMGHSAGAHMIASWAMNHVDTRVRGFIGIEGIYDIPELVKKWPTYKDQFISAEFGDSSKWKAASPGLNPIGHPAPWLIIHSKEDELVDLAQSLEFQKHLRSQNKKANLEILKMGTHFGVIEMIEKRNSMVSVAIEKFIQAHAARAGL